MESKKWVQHISGQGEKYEVDKKCDDYWEVSDNSQGRWYLRLPLKEYIPYDPPEEWEDVTGKCNLLCEGKVLQHANNNRFVGAVESVGYRLRMVKLYLANPDSLQNCEQWSFIVERKKS